MSTTGYAIIKHKKKGEEFDRIKVNENEFGVLDDLGITDGQGFIPISITTQSYNNKVSEILTLPQIPNGLVYFDRKAKNIKRGRDVSAIPKKLMIPKNSNLESHGSGALGFLTQIEEIFIPKNFTFEPKFSNKIKTIYTVKGNKSGFKEPKVVNNADLNGIEVKFIDDYENISFGINANQCQLKDCRNIAFGTNALQFCEKGIRNNAFGALALQNVTSSSNIGFGTSAGFILETGQNNICFGKNSDVSSKSAMNQIALGQGAESHGDNRLTFGGSKTEGTRKNALTEIHPGSNNFTSLGNKTHAFKSLYVSKMKCKSDLSLTLPTKDGDDKYEFVKTDNSGDLSFSNINRISGLIVQSKGKSKTITSQSGLAEISIDDIINGDGRLILDADTTSIKIKATAKDIIKKLKLDKDFDFVQNSFIKTNASSSLTLTENSNLTTTDGSNVKFTLHSGSGTQTITNKFNTIFRIARLSSTTVEIYFKNA